MKKTLATMMALVLTTAAQGQAGTVDTAQFVAVYDYECRTLDHEEQNVTDRMRMAVQVGRMVTKSMPFSAYPQYDEVSKADVADEFQEAYMHMPTVWTGLPAGSTTVREYIFPHEYEGYEPTPDIAWTLTGDTLTVSGYLCGHSHVPGCGVARVLYRGDSVIGRAMAFAWSARADCQGRKRGAYILSGRAAAGGVAHHRTRGKARCAADEICKAAETQERNLWQPPIRPEPDILCPRPLLHHGHDCNQT